MNDRRKQAYRMLLARGFLDIRGIAWTGASWRQRLNPFSWSTNSQRVRYAGALADWLHNLAYFSAHDFAAIDEDWFWRDFESLLKAAPGLGAENYRSEFERLATDVREEP